ncbi:hypothetical protein N7468_001101 [Penicillium chermesinum]|uniref:Gamma-glutamylcyclotransferase AIG2-like domain-containing protein n=1 Tax=Penicillium chermesinum TaxID=63820 RepID=A0A9W9PI65_9EURO|nr:uncharacterized protein N7468_001101 [Penicillium chermesinum]KAJ5246118.1 hypothetical protein N7468_001101 [Penicillium chermesinum]
MSSFEPPPFSKELQSSPPPPPPPPPVNLLSKVSPAVLKLKTKQRDPFFRAPAEITPPTGAYFFYGTLLDPNMLVEILGLDQTPTLRPASLDGTVTREEK